MDEYLKLLRNYHGTSSIVARDKNLVTTLGLAYRHFLAPLLRMDSNPILSSDVKKYQQAFLALLPKMDSNFILGDCV